LVDTSWREKMSTMSPKKRRQYTPEYRAEAVRQVKVGDRPLAHVARDLGLSMQTLWGWVHPDKPEAEKEEAGELSPTEREELKQLRRRVARLEEEREILKKATAFFAKESK
jgi:transposase